MSLADVQRDSEFLASAEQIEALFQIQNLDKLNIAREDTATTLTFEDLFEVIDDPTHVREAIFRTRASNIINPYEIPYFPDIYKGIPNILERLLNSTLSISGGVA